MNDAQILARLRDRDRLLAVVLESERDQGWPAKFDWREWRIRNAVMVTRLRRLRESRSTRTGRAFPPKYPQPVDKR